MIWRLLSRKRQHQTHPAKTITGPLIFVLKSPSTREDKGNSIGFSWVPAIKTHSRNSNLSGFSPHEDPRFKNVQWTLKCLHHSQQDAGICTVACQPTTKLLAVQLYKQWNQIRLSSLGGELHKVFGGRCVAGPHQPLGCHKPTCLNKNYMYVCPNLETCNISQIKICDFLYLISDLRKNSIPHLLVNSSLISNI